MLGFATLIPPVTPESSAQVLRNVTVQVGGGQDTMQALAFFPQNLRVHQGDTVTWKIVGDEPHTTAFTRGFDPGPSGVQSPLDPPGINIPVFAVPIPGGAADALQLNPQLAWPTRAPGAAVEKYASGSLFNSGVYTKQPMAPDVPANDTFSLNFPNTGTFSYICLVHADRMMGTIEVVSTNIDAPSQAAIDGTASRELDAITRLMQSARGQGETFVRSETGANNSLTWYVRAGNQDFESGDGRGQFLDFQPKNLNITSGDTVIWSTSYFHSITFSPTSPVPEWLMPIPQPSGPPLLQVNPQILAPAKPAATYDPTQYFNSGILGPFLPFGDSWALTFTQPGTFSYSCQVHAPLGMKGTITVQAPPTPS